MEKLRFYENLFFTFYYNLIKTTFFEDLGQK